MLLAAGRRSCLPRPSQSSRLAHSNAVPPAAMSHSDNRPSNALVWLFALVSGAGLLLISNWLVAPADAPFPGHGERFAAMAQDPFAFAGEFPQRILWPLLAWLCAQVGVTTLQFSSLCSAALLAVVVWFARLRTESSLDALLVGAAVAASGAVLVYQPMMCFSDTLNLLLLVLIVHFAAQPTVFWSLVLVTAFSHELVFFFTPWLVYLRVCNGGRLRSEILRWAMAVGVYGVFRVVLKLTGNTGPYDAAYYFEHAIWVPWALPAIWFLWGFVVLVEFGPLLVAFAFAGRSSALAQPSAMGGRLWPVLFWPSLLSLMLLAYDVMRFAPLVLPPLLLGLVALVRAPRGRAWLVALVALQVVSYAWLHPIAREQGGRHFTEVSGQILARLPLLASRKFASAMQFTGELIGQFWMYAAVAALALVGVVLVGCWLARRAYAEPKQTTSS